MKKPGNWDFQLQVHFDVHDCGLSTPDIITGFSDVLSPATLLQLVQRS